MIKNNDYIVIIRFQSIFLVVMHLKLIFSPAFQYAIFCRQSSGGCGQVYIGGPYRQVESKPLPVRGEEGEGWTRRVDGGWVRKGGVVCARLCWRGGVGDRKGGGGCVCVL